jgi:hypothetical protein
MFENRTLVIATKHHKEKVIAPLFETDLGVKCFAPDDFDTDALGTFTGEIERKDSSYETVKKKCLMAMEETDCDLGIASEGSFGNHPVLFMASADEELLIFIDKKNDLEIVVRELSLETNFNTATINSTEELNDFAKHANFPSHGLILKDLNNQNLYKGIQSWTELEEKANLLFKVNSSFIVETDMRALYNPTRMKVIEKAAINLLSKVKSLCPECQTPGFGVVKAISGLPCEWCKSKTKSIYSHLYQCQKCKYELEKKFPNRKETENPMYCDFCNP